MKILWRSPLNIGGVAMNTHANEMKNPVFEILSEIEKFSNKFTYKEGAFSGNESLTFLLLSNLFYLLEAIH